MSDVRNFGAKGDGKTDDTAAIRHAVANSIWVLRFSTGDYRINQTIEIPLGSRGPSAISGDEGTSRVVMTGASLPELDRCRRINVTGCQFPDGVPYGIDARDCSGVQVASCTVAELRSEKRAGGSIRFGGKGLGNRIALCNLDRAPEWI